MVLRYEMFVCKRLQYNVLFMITVLIIIIVVDIHSGQSQRLKWVHITCKIYLLKINEIIYNLRH